MSGVSKPSQGVLTGVIEKTWNQRPHSPLIGGSRLRILRLPEIIPGREPVQKKRRTSLRSSLVKILD